MQQNGEWAALVAAYPNILSCDWVRIPLPENADTIVGVDDGWPQSLALVVQKMKEHNVLFSGDEEIQSVFLIRRRLESGQKDEGFPICWFQTTQAMYGG